MKPRLLANENFPQPSVIALREAGYDVVAIAERHKSVNDAEVLSMAITEDRWIITFDRDYGELMLLLVPGIGHILDRGFAAIHWCPEFHD